jgi:hypothetical protein
VKKPIAEFWSDQQADVMRDRMVTSFRNHIAEAHARTCEPCRIFLDNLFRPFIVTEKEKSA